MSVSYVDVDSPEMSEYPALATAVAQGRSLPLILVGDEVKTPLVLSYSWIVNELKASGAIE